ncbi:hypothetical protein ULMS_01600 [Patiriisocius marinistellae]|uniref:Uncharacterized protein n=1 Tax=Patiriisocius marinistellae TaxID=2494560 RepID=A0A5J4FUI0_9FLAO|nr:T9SS type A sorting domain-containing protein [Patiriisocius marinistellae]GEQ84652.1 hypothetical protein ULMS_01600 [Patiriisocius marinistellae]
MKKLLLSLGLLFSFTFLFAQAPVNDDCSDRILITVSTTAPITVAPVDFALATEDDPLFVTDCETSSGTEFFDVWYEFTMPVTGNIVITDVPNTEYITLFSVNAMGDGCGGELLSCQVDDSVIGGLTAGTPYIIRYSERALFANISDFSIQAFESVANDDCANRETIAVTTTDINTYTTDFRAASEDDPLFVTDCETGAGIEFFDVWYEFTMPVTGNVVISGIPNTEYITLFSVNLAGDGCGGELLSCQVDDSVIGGLTAGTNYILRYSERELFANASNFSIQAFETVANDDCANRETIAVTTTGMNTYTTDFRAASEDDPLFVTGCETNAGIEFFDVWYEFTMPVTGNVVISGISNTEFITLFSVNSMNDGCGGEELSCQVDDSIIDGLTAGTNYVLRYSERELFANVSDFSIQAFESITNDDCSNRETITVTTTGISTYSTDFRAASEEDPFLITECETNANIEFLDVWYEFIMPVTGNIVITDVPNSEYFTIYDSCGGTELSCDVDDSVISGLTANTTYTLRYSERELFANASSFSIQAFEQEPNDNCSNATTINLSTLNPVFITTELRGASNDSEITCENNNTINYLDVWYEMTMPVDGEIQVNNVDNSISIAFFDSCEGNQISCFFNDGSLFNVEAGTILKMRASTREIFAGEYTFDVSVIPAPLPPCVETTEFISGEWNNGIPDNTMNAIIRANYNTATTIDPATMMPYGNLEACSVSIETGRTLTITAGNYLEVTSNILVNGTLNVEHQGSIVQRDDTAVTTNNGTINVNVTTPNIDPRDFMIMGSPMSNESRDGVFVDAFRVLKHNTNNFIPDPTVAAAFPMAENFADDDGDNWSTQTGVLNPAEGYFVQPQPDLSTGGAFDLTYNNGTLNNGVITTPLLFHTNKNSSPNMIANPYASAILADDFITVNPEIDEVYFWEHLTEPNGTLPGYNSANFSMEDISMYNLMGGVKAASDTSENNTKPNGLIATAQGFAVKANAAGTVTFNNTMRRLNGNTTLRTSNNTNKIWLNITNEQWEINGSTLIGFSENASEMLDKGYDSRRLATFLGIYSHLQDGSFELGIQSLGSFENTMAIPVGFSTQLAQDNASYTISIADLEGDLIENEQVYLVDTVTGIMTNLIDGSYTFNSSMGTFNNRFILKFIEEEVLNIENVSINNFVVYPNPAEDSINILSVNGSLISEVHIYDLQGRKLISEKLNVQHKLVSLDISVLNSAGYFITIITDNGSMTKSIVKE